MTKFKTLDDESMADEPLSKKLIFPRPVEE